MNLLDESLIELDNLADNFAALEENSDSNRRCTVEEVNELR